MWGGVEDGEGMAEDQVEIGPGGQHQFRAAVSLLGQTQLFLDMPGCRDRQLSKSHATL